MNSRKNEIPGPVCCSINLGLSVGLTVTTTGKILHAMGKLNNKNYKINRVRMFR